METSFISFLLFLLLLIRPRLIVHLERIVVTILDHEWWKLLLHVIILLLTMYLIRQ